MSNVSLGEKVPNFKLDATGEKKISLSDLKDKIIVLYFYQEIILQVVQKKDKRSEIISLNLNGKIP
jgi:peroxiredoxin